MKCGYFEKYGYFTLKGRKYRFCGEHSTFHSIVCSLYLWNVQETGVTTNQNTTWECNLWNGLISTFIQCTGTIWNSFTAFQHFWNQWMMLKMGWMGTSVSNKKQKNGNKVWNKPSISGIQQVVIDKHFHNLEKQHIQVQLKFLPLLLPNQSNDKQMNPRKCIYRQANRLYAIPNHLCDFLLALSKLLWYQLRRFGAHNFP